MEAVNQAGANYYGKDSMKSKALAKEEFKEEEKKGKLLDMKL